MVSQTGEEVFSVLKAQCNFDKIYYFVDWKNYKIIVLILQSVHLLLRVYWYCLLMSVILIILIMLKTGEPFSMKNLS